jgi:hypothetical protein
MDAVTREIFRLVVPSLPYVIAVYALLWAGLMVYVGFALSRVGRLERQLSLVEDELAKRGRAE